ncbi:MAG: hypothetical protein PHE12_00780 [Clostridia bacterium]|nr:hypothetical protein [Clostridia bacterium]
MLYNLSNNYLNVAISDIGAEIMSVIATDKTEYIWQGNPKFWKDRAINLFPVVGRLYGGYYVYKGQKYVMDIHGFIKSSVFNVLTSQNKAEFVFRSDKSTKKVYPFDFEYKITYTLCGNSLNVVFTVINTGGKNMYFCLGAHPGFNLPLEKNINEWQLKFDCKKDVNMFELKEGFITGKLNKFDLKGGDTILLDEKTKNMLPQTIILENPCKGVTLQSDYSNKSVHISYPDMNYLGLWSVQYAPYICIEPWTGLPSYYGKADELTAKKDIITLEKEKEYNNSITYIFS